MTAKTIQEATENGASAQQVFNLLPEAGDAPRSLCEAFRAVAEVEHQLALLRVALVDVRAEIRADWNGTTTCAFMKGLQSALATKLIAITKHATHP